MKTDFKLTKHFFYNAPLGNITNKSDQGSYTYGETGYANPHAVTDINGTTYSYNNNGNVTGIGSDTYTWDWKNRLVSSVVNSNTDYYTYDHNNIRTTKTNSTATTTYPNMYYNTDGATVTKHIFDPITGNLLATVEGNGTATSTNYIHTDHLGGTNVVTDENGGVKEVTDYYPFGEQRISEVTSGNAEQRKFTGHEFDSDTDLTYAKQRYYDQDVGRWLSQDPAFLFVGTQKLADIMKIDEKDGKNERRLKALQQYLSNPQQLNSYSYANNNPVNLTDPNGEIVPILPILAVYSAIQTAIDVYDIKTTFIDYPEVFTKQEKIKTATKVGIGMFTEGLTKISIALPAEKMFLQTAPAVLDVIENFFNVDYNREPNNVQNDSINKSTKQNQQQKEN